LALALAWLLPCGNEGETLPRWLFESFWREPATERLNDRERKYCCERGLPGLASNDVRERQAAFKQAAKRN
jgi:hypothetical protein